MKFQKIKKIKQVESEPIYHLTVENNHNFFANNLLVHNCSYRGEIKIILYNSTKIAFDFEKGDKVAQMVLCPVIEMKLKEIKELSGTERGEGGFGHTDKKELQNV